MKIGLAYDLKSEQPLAAGLSDDAQEEYDSPATIESIAGVIRSLGHEVLLLGDGRELIERVLRDPPDLVFNIAEGYGISRSREARVPAFLEMLGIPYTGSDPLTLSVTLDKDCARRLVASHGGIVPRGHLIDPGTDLASLHSLPLPYPAIVKPAWEGSSKGIRGKCVVDSPVELARAVEERRDQGQPLLAEEFIAGDELTVGVVGNDPPAVVGILRVIPLVQQDRFVYSLEVKRDYERQVRYEAPAQLPAETRRAVEQAALLVYRVLGCRDVSRIDFRLRDGVPYFLEVNPLPGLSPITSDLVILSKGHGLDYHNLIRMILEAALARARK